MKTARRLLAIILVLSMFLMNGGVTALADAVLTMPAALQIIDEEAFYGDTFIDKVVLPNNITEIRARAFANSTLSEINLPDSLTFIAEDAFDGPDKVTVTVNPGTYAYTWAVDHHYIDDTALRVTVTCSAESAVPEESVTWTAEGVNGVAPYKYRYQLFCDGTRIATRAYSATSTYTYKFTKAGTYYVLVQLKDDDGEIVEVQSADIIVSLESLRVAEVTCDKETIQTTETATWSAAATGGEQPYQYCFVLKRGSTVIDTQDYSSADTYSYAFELDGSYSLEVTAKDNLGTVSAVDTMPFNVALRPVEITSITADANSAVTESTITWTVETIAGKAPYTYDYEVKLDGVSKIVETGSSENTFTYNTETAGSCVVTVNVTDAAGNTATLNSSAITITTKTLTIDAITAESEWVKVGDTVNWSVEASGGVKPLRYAFDVYLDGEEIDGRAFKTSNTYSYEPEEAGDYTARVRVRDASNITVELGSAVVHVYDPISVISLVADHSSVQTGEPVIWTATVNGGKGTITYDWFIYFGNELEYTSRSTDNSIKWATMRAGAYQVTVKATDEEAEEATLTGGNLITTLHPSTPAEDFSYNILNGTYCEITGYNGSDIAIILPGEDPTGHIVQRVANNAFQNNKNIVSVVFADSIETMGSDVFSGCSNLINFTGGSGLTNIGSGAFQNNTAMKQFIASNAIIAIGQYAFSGCTGLTSVSLPEGLKTINSGAFLGCTSLKSIHLPDSITRMDNCVFSNCTKLETVNYPSGLITISRTDSVYVNNSWRYGVSPFYYCPALKSITVPEGVTTIPAKAFYEATGFTSVSLPSTLKTIGENAFYGASGLTAIEIPNGVTSIGASAFAGCVGLRSVVIPDSVTSIGNNAFSDCTGITSVIVSSSLTNLNQYVFSGCSGLTSVSLPEGLKTINSGAFLGCTSLKSIHLPDSITRMDNCVFSNCTKLETVNYPSGLITISRTDSVYVNNSWRYGVSPFYYCPALKSITVPEGVTTIPAKAFYEATGFTSVSLPSTLKTIGENAFYGCTSLVSVNIGSAVESIGNNAFANHNSNLVVYGKAGSYAETYASNNNITFSTSNAPETLITLSGRVLTNDAQGIENATVKLYLDQYTGVDGITLYRVCSATTQKSSNSG